MAMDNKAFKSAMRRLAATVSIIATGGPEGTRYGMTATAVTSVSLDPPSLLVCVNRNASIHDPLCELGRFCINVLGTGHEDHCLDFSGRTMGESRFERGSWQTRFGVPYLVDAQASIFCEVDERLGYGSHTIFIGRVTDCLVRGDARPLIYVNGTFAAEPMERACSAA
jgi:flavin reductase (DIM6/NTAB) family NADH-FMN oxidoreductase RutF